MQLNVRDNSIPPDHAWPGTLSCCGSVEPCEVGLGIVQGYVPVAMDTIQSNFKVQKASSVRTTDTQKPLTNEATKDSNWHIVEPERFGF